MLNKKHKKYNKRKWLMEDFKDPNNWIGDNDKEVCRELGITLKQYTRFRNYLKYDKNGCLIYTGPNMDSNNSNDSCEKIYGTFSWMVNRNSKTTTSHRLYLYFKEGEVFDRYWDAGHKCKNSLCVKHVSKRTRSQNLGKDKIRDGTDNRGEKSGRATITWKQADKVKKYVINNKPVHHIAKKTNIPAGIVNNIANGNAWVNELTDKMMEHKTNRRNKVRRLLNKGKSHLKISKKLNLDMYMVNGIVASIKANA